ncbi:MAG: GH3 auxin-responsive promoter family protein [Bacillota bacterium]|nr:GH3 auxin-responsive promoter family protein [Bacillota bacterium]
MSGTVPRRLLTLGANTLLRASFRAEAARFRRALVPGAAGEAALRQGQLGLLRQTVELDADTAYGRERGFRKLLHYEGEDFLAAWRDQVPLETWTSLAPYVERTAAGEPAVLTGERIRRLEPTSGSGGAVKLIPYGERLRRAFARGIAAWLTNLYQAHPRLLRTRSYWSVTPVGDRPTRSAGGLVIGFDDETDYLGRLGARAMRAVFVSRPGLAAERDMERFFRHCLEDLVTSPDLGLISVWNPSFLLRLLERLGQRDWTQLWPELSVISCWADAAAAQDAWQLELLFPQVRLQPKGLLATEGFVSLPWEDGGEPLLAWRSHHFEFLPLMDDGTVRINDAKSASDLLPGARYEVVVTNGGGLCRYRLGDRILVSRKLGAVPRFRFIGRGQATVDLHGEKLAESEVTQVLDRLLPAAGDGPGLCLLAPHPSRRCYLLFCDTARLEKEPDSWRLEAALDLELRKHYHYDYCRRLGQLERARVVPVPGDAEERYVAAELAEGRRLGDLKPLRLSGRLDWAKRLGVDAAIMSEIGKGRAPE